jgi:hypothetical protein
MLCACLMRMRCPVGHLRVHRPARVLPCAHLWVLRQATAALATAVASQSVWAQRSTQANLTLHTCYSRNTVSSGTRVGEAQAMGVLHAAL